MKGLTMLFPEDYRGPMVAGAGAYHDWSAEELERRASAILGSQWQRHLTGLMGLSRSTIFRLMSDGVSHRDIKRDFAFTVACLEQIKKAGGEVPMEFCDYELTPIGRPSLVKVDEEA